MASIEVPPHRVLETLPTALEAKRQERAQLQAALQRVEQEIRLIEPQLRFEQARTVAQAGVEHHDHKCRQVGEAALKVTETWQAFVMACRHLVQTRDDQIRGLHLPDARGKMAWKLPSGDAALQTMLGAFPGQPATLTDSVLHALRSPPTQEEMHRSIAKVPGRAPFPPERVHAYLATYEYDTEGKEDHGQHS
jgi:hypothetical protein